MTLQIELGKFYKTKRDGLKVGPITASDDFAEDGWPFESKFVNEQGEKDSAYFRADGTCPYLPQYDLIEEVTL